MIRYALACDAGHDFESWFPSASSYDDQAARGLVTCPACGSGRVGKRIMAPSVARADKGLKSAPLMPPPAAPEAPRPMALLSEAEREVRTMIRALREHVTANAENVGTRFADEARMIHHGEAEPRSIYGQASPAEARALMEEGVDVAPLPVLPEDRN
jgi:hypothetical protein